MERFPHPKPLNRDPNLFIFVHQFVLYGRFELFRSFLSGKNVFPSIESKCTNEHCILVFLSSAVRQENERLVQDSLIRARMAANFTDPPPIIQDTTSTPSHHPNLKMLQGNFVP